MYSTEPSSTAVPGAVFVSPARELTQGDSPMPRVRTRLALLLLIAARARGRRVRRRRRRTRLGLRDDRRGHGRRVRATDQLAARRTRDSSPSAPTSRPSRRTSRTTTRRTARASRARSPTRSPTSSGFEKDEVKWTVVPFNSSYAPGPEEVRLRHQPDLDHAAARRARRLLRAVLHGAAGGRRAKGSPAADATVARRPQGRQARRPDRHDEPRRGRATSIKPIEQPQVFNDSNDIVRALKQDQVDAIVVDLPTAFYLTAAEVPRREDRRPVRRAGRRRLGRCCSRRTRR